MTQTAQISIDPKVSKGYLESVAEQITTMINGDYLVFDEDYMPVESVFVGADYLLMATIKYGQSERVACLINAADFDGMDRLMLTTQKTLQAWHVVHQSHFQSIHII